MRKPIDWIGISNALSGISFLVGLCSVKKMTELFTEVFVPATISMGCQIAAGVSKIEKISDICAATLLIMNVADKTNSVRATSMLIDDLIDDLME